MIAPDEKKDSRDGQRTRQQGSCPGHGRPTERLSHFAKADQQQKDSGQMVIKLRIGNALARSFPLNLPGGSMTMVVRLPVERMGLAMIGRLGHGMRGGHDGEHETKQRQERDRWHQSIQALSG